MYQDTKTFQIDSTYLFDAVSQVFSHSGGGESCKEHVWIYQGYESTLRGQYWEVVKGDRIGEGWQFYEKFTCNATKIDSLIVSNITYFDVIKLNLIKSETISELSYWIRADLYYKEGIGVIRREIFNPPIDTNTFDLIRHDVTLFNR